jgi:hypothetical protein
MDSKAKWLLRIVLGFVAVVFSVFLVFYYEFDYKPKHEAKSVIEQFHQRMNSGDLSQDGNNTNIHKGLGSSRDECLALIRKIQDSLGNSRP